MPTLKTIKIQKRMKTSCKNKILKNITVYKPGKNISVNQPNERGGVTNNVQ